MPVTAFICKTYVLCKEYDPPVTVRQSTYEGKPLQTAVGGLIEIVVTSVPMSHSNGERSV